MWFCFEALDRFMNDSILLANRKEGESQAFILLFITTF